MPDKTRLGLIFLAASLVGLAAPAAADVLVVRSTGPSANAYPPGRSLPDTARLVLRSGDIVVLLSNHGTRTILGPGSFTAGWIGTGSPAAGSTGRSRVGAVRPAPRQPARFAICPGDPRCPPRQPPR